MITLEYDQLEAFYYVAKLGTFVEAAEHLARTQPAMSMRIKNLEIHIGKPLIVRRMKGNRRNVLTKFGCELFCRLHVIITQMKSINSLCFEEQLESIQTKCTPRR